MYDLFIKFISEVPVPIFTEESILRATDNNDIFVVRVLKNDVVMSQKLKKNDRVYNKQHACLFCLKTFTKLAQHITTCKRRDKDVISSNSHEMIRNLGNHVYNKRTIEEGKGMLILKVRPTDQFCAYKYNPCPNCFEWIRLDLLRKHSGTCKHSGPCLAENTRAQLVYQSKLVSGRIDVTNVCVLMQQKVFPYMRNTANAQIAQSDITIVELGRHVYKELIHNPKGRNYASQRMLLNAKLLTYLRKATNMPNANMDDFIDCSYFDYFVEGALHLSLPSMEDVSELNSPTNGIKIKYDIMKMADLKWKRLAKKHNVEVEKNRADDFIKMVKRYWRVEVTKLSRNSLVNRCLSGAMFTLPSPKDIQTVMNYLMSELKSMNKLIAERKLPETIDSYYKLCNLLQPYLNNFNKRRPNEVDQSL